jgi:hypothetical protein
MPFLKTLRESRARKRSARQSQAALGTVREQAQQTGGVVCATLDPSGEPRYFVMAPDATADDVSAAAFKHRWGADPSNADLILRQIADRYSKRAPIAR